MAALAQHGRFVDMSAFGGLNLAYVKQAVPAPTCLPDSLRELYTPANRLLSDTDLRTRCAEYANAYTMPVSQIQLVEEQTRNQASSMNWYSVCTGRITASVAHQLLHTNKTTPAPSLVKKVCQKVKPLQVPAVQWGVSLRRMVSMSCGISGLEFHTPRIDQLQTRSESVTFSYTSNGS